MLNKARKCILMDKYCSKCGSELKENEKFCSKCGQKCLISDVNNNCNNTKMNKISRKFNYSSSFMYFCVTALVIIVGMVCVSIVCVTRKNSNGYNNNIDGNQVTEIESQQETQQEIKDEKASVVGKWTNDIYSVEFSQSGEMYISSNKISIVLKAFEYYVENDNTIKLSTKIKNVKVSYDVSYELISYKGTDFINLDLSKVPLIGDIEGELLLQKSS